MKALCWQGIGKLSVERVDDPSIINRGDAIVRVTVSSVCGSDLHLINGYMAGMREGDIIGHEFLGEVVEVGPGVRTLSAGQRVVVGSVIACGGCWHCQRGEPSLCDNTNPNAAIPEKMWGHAPAGIFGYSHATGGFAGSHAEYVRVPFADLGCHPVPDSLADDTAVYASDAVPTGWMAADLCGIASGDVVAVWGAGGVGQMAARAAQLMGAGRVVVIDRFVDRLKAAEERLGVETLDYSRADVAEALREITAGRGPDRCIEAVGMEAHDTGMAYAYDRMKQGLRLQTDRPTAVREAIMACRKGGTVSIIGAFGGLVDKFPLGAVMNKALTLRSGQQFWHRYIPTVLDRMARGEIDPGYLTTHPLPLDEGPRGYELFARKLDGCLRAVFHP
jgi:threonine dehydrogenase-like Zn-dependent dehydrogenase